MKERKPTPRATKVVAAGLFAGLAAATLGQHFYPSWTLASQTHTIIVVVLGVLVGALIAGLATRD